MCPEEEQISRGKRGRDNRKDIEEIYQKDNNNTEEGERESMFC